MPCVIHPQLPNRKKYTLHSQTRSAATSLLQLEEEDFPFGHANPANRKFCSLAKEKPLSPECFLSSTEVTLVPILMTYFVVLPSLTLKAFHDV